MRNLRRAFWGALVLLVLLWLVAEPTVLQSTTFFGLRRVMVQLTGVVAIGCMSLAMVLALRPLWPQAWLGGLDSQILVFRPVFLSHSSGVAYWTVCVFLPPMLAGLR